MTSEVIKSGKVRYEKDPTKKPASFYKVDSFFKMPRAQDFLSGAVWIISLTSFLNKAAETFDVHQTAVESPGLIDGADLFDREWTAKDLAILKLVMDEHVVRFKEELEAISYASSRSKRAGKETCR